MNENTDEDLSIPAFAICHAGEHHWRSVGTPMTRGWEKQCMLCNVCAPEPFCRQPDKCVEAGYCLSDHPCCND